MKILVIGDVHGTQHWKKHISKFEDFDKVVFLGDYFDDWKNDWTKVDQIENLKQIIEYKKSYQFYNNKIELLIGNHDLAYLTGEIISGRQEYKAFDIKEFLESNLKHFNIACLISSCVFSHAGFSSKWMKTNGFHGFEEVNKALQQKYFSIFNFNGNDCYGDDTTQGPTWIRPKSLISNSYFANQVVGHTAINDNSFSHVEYLLPDKRRKGNIYIVDNNEHSACLELYTSNDEHEHSAFLNLNII